MVLGGEYIMNSNCILVVEFEVLFYGRFFLWFLFFENVIVLCDVS